MSLPIRENYATHGKLSAATQSSASQVINSISTVIRADFVLRDLALNGLR